MLVLGLYLLQDVDSGAGRLAGDGEKTQHLKRFVADLVVEQVFGGGPHQALVGLHQQLDFELADGVEPQHGEGDPVLVLEDLPAEGGGDGERELLADVAPDIDDTVGEGEREEKLGKEAMVPKSHRRLADVLHHCLCHAVVSEAHDSQVEQVLHHLNTVCGLEQPEERSRVDGDLKVAARPVVNHR